MRTVYMVPGLLGTELESTSIYGNVLWVNPTRIALGQLDQLGLEANGSTPLPPEGVAMGAPWPIDNYYRRMRIILQDAVAGAGDQVKVWPFDWRKDILAAGSALASDILSTSTSADPATLVCHSQGGLVARAAWRELVLSDQSSLVRRIITLGTPHRGSYSPVRVWSLHDEVIDMIQLLTSVPSALTFPSGLIYAPQPWSALRIARLTATFPAFYQMLPTLFPGYEASDPHRADLYDPAKWPPDRGLYANQLGLAAQVFRAFLLDPDSMPPTHVLTTVAGTGVLTPNRLTEPYHVGSVTSLGYTGSGDGRVTTDSALVEESARFLFPGVHGSLQQSSWFAGNAQSLIYDERLPPAPPPALVTSNGPVLPIVAGPPLTRPVSGGSSCAGRCTC